jgi:hypothetical protein
MIKKFKEYFSFLKHFKYVGDDEIIFSINHNLLYKWQGKHLLKLYKEKGYSSML